MYFIAKSTKTRAFKSYSLCNCTKMILITEKDLTFFSKVVKYKLALEVLEC
jgi:hypothetical protein